MAKRIVTELDFRMPEFRNAKVEDYEWRDDDKLVRKDRWENGIRRIASRLGMSRGQWEIEDIVERVSALIDSPDAVRLDWLESEGNSLHAEEDGDEVYFQVVSYHMAVPSERVEGRGKTPRAAIDAAIASAEASHG